MTPLIGIVGLSGQSVMMRTDHFHRPGETVAAHTLFEEPGGKGYNQAVAAARLGARVRYLSAVGHDLHGDMCIARMEREGVDARWIRCGKHTAYANILTNREGDNQVTVFRGAADDLTAAHIEQQQEWLAECDALLIQLECPQETVRATLELGRKYGLPIYLNPAPAQAIPRAWMNQFALMIPNECEMMQLLELEGRPDDCAIKEAMLRNGLDRLLVTMGGDGVLYLEKGSLTRWKPPKIQAVDTTGAGDTFCAAFTVRHALGDSVEDAVRFAMKAAAFCVCQEHVLDALPYLHQLEA